MGLRDRMNTAPATQPGPEASLPNSSAPPVSPPTPGVTPAQRDLSALRARLAQSGGVNPPEAPAAITEEMFQPQTRETADGGAELIAPIATNAPQDTTVPAKRKRRTKAEMQADAAQNVAPPSAPPGEIVPSADAAALESEPTLLSLLARIADALEVLSTRAL